MKRESQHAPNWKRKGGSFRGVVARWSLPGLAVGVLAVGSSAQSGVMGEGPEGLISWLDAG